MNVNARSGAGPTRIMWFRRDLRLADNPALLRAADGGGSVVGLFVVDPRLLDASVRSRRLAASVAALSTSMAGALVIRLGDPTSVVTAVAKEVDADEVHISADFGPYGRSRDAGVAAALESESRRLVATGSPYAVSPGRITKADGTPYRVYTPFYRSWLSHGWRAPAGEPASSAAPTPPHPLRRPEVTWCRLAGEDPEWFDQRLAELDAPQPRETLASAGEEAAHERWVRFWHDGLADYGQLRDRPDTAGTSQLSAHLRFGEIHPRTLLFDLAGLGASSSAEAFRREIAFREFYADVLWHRPDSATQSLDQRFDTHMVYNSGAEARAAFDAWCTGRTGFPIVDAGMRQLLAEGWIHNRVRMVVASFLVKDLHLPWWWGAKWFMARLRDGDLASNVAGWQWTAGCGTDASPFHRVFNPIAQGKKFDPNADYVRRYVPELRGLAGAGAHEPWQHPLLAPDYPAPMVNHATERLEALERHRAMKAASQPGAS